MSSKCSKPCRFLSRKLACSLPPREFPDEQKSLLQTLVGNSHSACPLATFGNIDAGRCQIGKFLRSPRPPIRPVMADRRNLGKAQPGGGRASDPSGVPARCVCERIGQHLLPGGNKEPAKPLLYWRSARRDANLRVGRWMDVRSERVRCGCQKHR